MKDFRLRCLDCDLTHDAGVAYLNCPHCGGLFDIEYEQDAQASLPRLPLSRPHTKISLGEGTTPVVHLNTLSSQLGLDCLWAKLEYVSPTGSFKDRGSAVLISAALEDGITEFVEDSSGNAGASMAAFAAAAGLKAHVFVPSSTSVNKLNQLRVYGATVHTIEGSREAATIAAREMADSQGILYLSHNYGPYFAEGMKSFSIEVMNSEANEVQHIIFPVGNGSLLVGAAKGLLELFNQGTLLNMPKLHCVQTGSVSPIASKINKQPWKWDSSKQTVASGISVSNPPRSSQVVNAVRASGGSATTVSDSAILKWQLSLARTEGIFCEVTSATVLAGLESLMTTGIISQGSKVLVPITGSGLKEPGVDTY